MTAATLPAWWKPARRALDLAAKGELRDAVPLVEGIAAKYGTDVIPCVLVAWIDTMAVACGVDEFQESVRLAFREVGDSAITSAGAVPPATAWAGQLIAARLADDEATFRALIETVSDDQSWGKRVLQVLSMTALTMKRGIRR